MRRSWRSAIVPITMPAVHARLSHATVAAVFVVAAFVGACAGDDTRESGAAATLSPGVTATPGEGTTAAPNGRATAAPASPGAATASADPATPPSGAAWATAELRDVRTGATFRIADFAGRTVFVQTMAIWCPSCRAQQDDARVALERLPDEVVWIGLDVDPSETEPDLAAYAEQHGYDWRFAVASPEVATSLADEFGPLVLNPPSTPLLVVGPDGTVTKAHDGHKSVDEILALAAAAGS